MKKVLAILLTVAMVMAMGLTAFANGDGSITVKNATKNVTYKAYKLLDATYSGSGDNLKIAYTVSSTEDKAALSADGSPFDVATTADANGKFAVTVKSGKSDDDVLTWIKANYSSLSGGAAASAITGTFDDSKNECKFTGLDYGYYYITSSLGAVVTIDSVAKDATVEDKNTQGPSDEDKTITKEGTTELAANTKANDAAVGTKQTFEVKFNATNWKTVADGDDTKITNYVIEDAPTGLKIDNSTVVVKINGETKTVTTDYTSKVDASNGKLTVTIPWVNAAGDFLYDNTDTTGKSASIPVVITYDAEVTKDAATAVAENKVDVKYNNNVDIDNTTHKTTTTTYKFQLDKVKEDGTELTGAKFELYKGTKDAANKVSLVETADGYRVAESTDATTVTEIDLTAVAYKVISGLDKGTYVLVETVVPSGYNSTSDTTVTEASLVAVSGTITDGANVVDGANVTTPNDTGVVTVVNKSGSELPETGGMGTTIFYVAGMMLVIGAGVIMITRRRMEGNY